MCYPVWQGLWNHLARCRLLYWEGGPSAKAVLIRTPGPLFRRGFSLIPLRPRRDVGLHGRRRCY
jgi:hypothetical protein